MTDIWYTEAKRGNADDTPADRFIIVAAFERALPGVTGDHRFAEYGVNVNL